MSDSDDFGIPKKGLRPLPPMGGNEDYELDSDYYGKEANEGGSHGNESPKQQSENMKEGLAFSVLATVFEAFLMVVYAGLTTCIVDEQQALSFDIYYNLFRDVNIMIFFGFGFLMTFLRRYAFSAVGYTFIISALVVQWSVIVQIVFEYIDEGAYSQKELDVTNLLEGLFCAGAVMISYGAVLGKVSPLQLLIMGIVEPVFYWTNNYLSLTYFEAVDIGGGYTIHMFGCYFGIAVCRWFSPRESKDHPDESSSYTSDIFSLSGTLFLWLLWPSFNAVLAPDGIQHTRAALNTFLSLTGATVMTFAVSRVVTKWKFNAVHVQNSTLAGGVAMGIAAHFPFNPSAVIGIGALAGSVSVLGYRFLSPLLSRFSFHDVCGVHNLHGMPSLIAAGAGIIGGQIFVWTDGMDKAIDFEVGKQVIALALTLGLAVVGGIVAGGLMRLAQVLLRLSRDDFFNDARFWHVPDDFHSSSSPPSFETM